MSKGNMLLGHARGKVGSLVFSRANGQQIVRSRAEVVKNPRTDAQTIQRIILNTVAQAYSVMSPIVDHSFEGFQVGQPSMSYFMSTNAKTLRGLVAAATNVFNVQAFTPVGSNTFSLNPYRIAKGSLPSIVPAIKMDEQTTQVSASFPLSANTYAALLADYSLQRGDQLTFVAVHSTPAEGVVFSYNRVILDPKNADGTDALLSVPFCTANAVASPSPKNEGSFTQLSFADGKVTYVIGDTDRLLAVGIIVSRKKADNSWSRSNADLVTLSIEEAEFGMTMGEAMQRSYGGNVDVNSPLYLNNAVSASGSVGQAPEVPTITAGTYNGQILSASSVLNVADSNAHALSLTIDNAELGDGYRVALCNQNDTVASILGEIPANGQFSAQVAAGDVERYFAIVQGTDTNATCIQKFGGIIGPDDNSGD